MANQRTVDIKVLFEMYDMTPGQKAHLRNIPEEREETRLARLGRWLENATTR